MQASTPTKSVSVQLCAKCCFQKGCEYFWNGRFYKEKDQEGNPSAVWDILLSNKTSNKNTNYSNNFKARRLSRMYETRTAVIPTTAYSRTENVTEIVKTQVQR